MSRILVEGIKPPVNEDKLTIHFQKRKNNGGDVESVIFPINSKQPDSAVVDFEDQKVADSVLEVDQVFNGSKLKVSKEYQIFSKFQATFDSHTLQILLKNCNKSIDEIIVEIKNVVPDVQITNSQLGLIMAAKSWYHLQMVRDLVQSMLITSDDGSEEVSATTEKPTIQIDAQQKHSATSDDVAGTSSQSAAANDQNKTETFRKAEVTRMKPVVAARQKFKEETLSFNVDKDVMGFLRAFYAKDLLEIETSKNVKLSFADVHSESTRVTCVSTTYHNKQLKAAKTEVLKLFQTVQNLEDFQHEIVSVKDYQNDFNQNMSVLGAINSTREQSSDIFVSLNKSDAEPKVSFISTRKGQTEVSIKWFQNFFTIFKRLKAKEANINVYNFIKHTKPITLLSFERERCVRITEIEDGDLLAIFLLPQKEFKDNESADASRRFDALMKENEEKLSFFNCHLKVKDLKPFEIKEKLEGFQRANKSIYVRRSKGCADRVTLTGYDARALKKADEKLQQAFANE